jgi:hypothetical protein
MHNKLVRNLVVSFCKVGEEGIEKKLPKRGRMADKDKVIGKPPRKGSKMPEASKVSGKSSSPIDVCAQ